MNHKKMELRMFESKIDVQSDNSLTVSGYVNKTNELSEVLGSGKRFREKISKGAFARAIQNRTRDIDFLAEHNEAKILSSTRNGSLKLTEDDQGLFMEATITPTSWGKDYYELISSNILQNMSFGFKTTKDSWRNVGAGLYERTIEELNLFEVSVVKNPAYSQSTISARGIDVVEDIQIPKDIQTPNKKSEVKKEERKVNMKAEDYIYGNARDLELEKRTEDFQVFNDYIRSDRSLQTTVDGGSLVPETVADLVVQKMENISPVFALAKKFPSVHGTLKIGKEDEHSFEAGFVGEGEDVVEGAMALDEVKLTQKRVGASVHLTNMLINDSAMNIPDYVASLLGRRIVRATEKSILTGNTAEEFKGIIHDTEIGEFTVATIAGINYETLMDLYLSVHPDFLTGAAFIANKTAFQAVSKLKDGAGHYYVQNGVVNGKPTRTLFGAELIVTDSLPDTNPMVFGNITEGYAIMIKKDQSLQLIQDSKTALAGTKMFLADMYMDGAVYNPQALAKLTVQA